MTEVTRVPLKPVSQGALTKLWIGVVVAILLGAGLAFAAVPKGFSLDTIVAGEGAPPNDGDLVFLRYTGKLAASGEVFDQSQDIPLPIEGIFPEGSPFPVEEGATIPGFYKALQQVRKGGQYELFIPADLGYGAEPPPGSPIPPDADLIFEIEVVDFMSREAFDRNLSILQRALQGAGAPGGPGAPPPGQNVPGPMPE
ncbi:MAG: FKBP-type peptidyl-prolyl cis-trans isomerase [Erythrobacter sp.]|jgi:FKBP-type peptidyl-prolyl cis-trans isomerase FkpA|nr:FKBP-type peptidyl-prolyl cis-trans isomerase [Erythrobacter sp.]